MNHVGFPCLPTPRSDTARIYDIAPGKLVFEDGTLKRVYSRASNGTCFYVAIERLFCSPSNIPNDLEELQQFSRCLQTLEENLNNVEKEFSSLFLPKLAEFYKRTNQATAVDMKSCYAFINLPFKMNEFINSSFTNYYDFLFDQYCSAQERCFITFLSRNCSSESFELMIKKIEGSPVNKRVALLQKMAQDLSASKYGFQLCPWDGTQDIDQFLETFKTYGPLLVSGQFGDSYYSTCATTTSSILLRKYSICIWKAGSQRVEGFKFHAVIIVGVSKEATGRGGGYVYFLDPNDESDPESSTLEKVYKISYQNLKDNSRDFPFKDGRAIYASGLLA